MMVFTIFGCLFVKKIKKIQNKKLGFCVLFWNRFLIVYRSKRKLNFYFSVERGRLKIQKLNCTKSADLIYRPSKQNIHLVTNYLKQILSYICRQVLKLFRCFSHMKRTQTISWHSPFKRMNWGHFPKSFFHKSISYLFQMIVFPSFLPWSESYGDIHK